MTTRTLLIRSIKILPDSPINWTLRINFGKLKEKNAHILLKENKRNFNNYKQASLINPTKTELGLTTKNIIERIAIKRLNKSEYNSWRISLDAINWFENIDNKKSTTFIQFDVTDFYSSISKE